MGIFQEKLAGIKKELPLWRSKPALDFLAARAALPPERRNHEYRQWAIEMLNVTPETRGAITGIASRIHEFERLYSAADKRHPISVKDIVEAYGFVIQSLNKHRHLSTSDNLREEHAKLFAGIRKNAEPYAQILIRDPNAVVALGNPEDLKHFVNIGNESIILTLGKKGKIWRRLMGHLHSK
ncbi:MAG: hypothetical protein AABX01_02875 [Candidatus Micrarchaeota archaeon]